MPLRANQIGSSPALSAFGVVQRLNNPSTCPSSKSAMSLSALVCCYLAPGSCSRVPRVGMSILLPFSTSIFSWVEVGVFSGAPSLPGSARW